MKKVGTILFIVLNVLFSYIFSIDINGCKNWGTWNKFGKLSCIFVRKQGLSLTRQEEIYICYIRPVLLHCCETLELTVADEAALYRWSVIWYIFTIYVYITSNHIQNMSNTSSQSHMGFESNTLAFVFWCLFKWASNPDTRTIKHSQRLHKNSRQITQSFAWILATKQIWAPPKVTFYILSTSTLAQRNLKFNFLPFSVPSLTFSLRLIKNCDAAQYC